MGYIPCKYDIFTKKLNLVLQNIIIKKCKENKLKNLKISGIWFEQKYTKRRYWNIYNLFYFVYASFIKDLKEKDKQN